MPLSDVMWLERLLLEIEAREALLASPSSPPPRPYPIVLVTTLAEESAA